MREVEYKRKRYKSFDQRYVDWREKRILLELIKGLDPPPKRILDVPVGFGRFTSILMGTSSFLVGVDINPAMISLAPGKRLVVGDIRRLPFPDNSFDLVVVIRLLQHLKVEDKFKALCEVGRVTRMWAIVSFYRKNFIHQAERVLFGRSWDLGMITPREFVRMCRDAGFEPQLLLPLFSFHSQTFALLRKRKS